jgi:hypothetical protein
MLVTSGATAVCPTIATEANAINHSLLDVTAAPAMHTPAIPKRVAMAFGAEALHLLSIKMTRGATSKPPLTAAAITDFSAGEPWNHRTTIRRRKIEGALS